MVLKAVRYVSSYFLFANTDLQTPELVRLAVEGDWYNFKAVRPDLQTYELALIAVKDWYKNLEHIPAHLQTQEVVEAALKRNPDAEQYIKVKGNSK
jgi:hypothetical protein